MRTEAGTSGSLSGATGVPAESAFASFDGLPLLLLPEEAAILLRTTKKAIYTMAERGQLPGVVRLGRRLLVRRDDLLDFLHRSRAASPKERRWA